MAFEPTIRRVSGRTALPPNSSSFSTSVIPGAGYGVLLTARWRL